MSPTSYLTAPPRVASQKTSNGFPQESTAFGPCEPTRMRVAVVDIGTNTTRLLVADVENGQVRELDRRTKVTRLGEGVDRSGRLADAAIARVAETLATYKAAIDELQPEH